MKKVENILSHYANKCFEIPKALFFGKYETMSIKAKFYLVFFKEISQIDNTGTLYLKLNDIKQYKDIIDELRKFELIELIDDKIYFLEIQINNEIVKKIQELEQSKKINIKDDKEVKQEKYIEQGYFGNDDIPAKLRDVLQVFSESTDEANEYFSIIMKAKKSVEKKSDEVIWLDNDDDMLDQVIKSFTRSVRKIKRENIQNKNGYIYKSIVTGITQKIAQRKRSSSNLPNPLYNWLEN